jgi:hypothetical protein
VVKNTTSCDQLNVCCSLHLHTLCLQGYRYALCVFGLARSLNWTIHSFEHRLLAPIANAGHTYDIFMHTYTVVRRATPVAGEEPSYNHSHDFQLLNLTR